MYQGDSYEKVDMKVSNSNMQNVEIVRADYYEYLKVFCLNFTQVNPRFY